MTTKNGNGKAKQDRGAVASQIAYGEWAARQLSRGARAGLTQRELTALARKLARKLVRFNTLQIRAAEARHEVNVALAAL